MWRKIIALLLALGMALSLAACKVSSGGGDGTDENGVKLTDSDRKNNGDDGQGGGKHGGAAAIRDYATAYSFASGLGTKADDLIAEIAEAYNARIEQSDPENYWNRDDYYAPILMSFLSIDWAFTASFSESEDFGSLKMGFAMLFGEDIQIERRSAHSYTMEWTNDDGGRTLMEADYDPATQGLRFRESTDGAITTFIEFAVIGDDEYVMQDAGTRLWIRLDGDTPAEFYMAYMKNDYAYDWEDESTADKRTHDAEADSIYKKSAGIGKDWVMEKRDDLQTIFSYADGVLTVERCRSETLYDDSFQAVGREWSWKEPSVYPKKG